MWTNARLADIKYNDIVDCDQGICVSLWLQGCPFHCKGCHNEVTWDFQGGRPIPENIKQLIINGISENNIKRNFSLLGGEPLCPENLNFSADILNAVRTAYPTIKIFVWTGYTIEQLKYRMDQEPQIKQILSKIDVLIDGPYIESQRDITLPLRGSRNQRVLYHGVDF